MNWKLIEAWVEYDSSSKQLKFTLYPVHVAKTTISLLFLTKDLSPYLLEWTYVGFTSSMGMHQTYCLPGLLYDYVSTRVIHDFLEKEEVLDDWEVRFGPYSLAYKDLCIAKKGFKNSELLGKVGFGKS